MVEDNIRTFAQDWIGTGSTSGSGDEEIACLDAGEYLESEVINTGVVQARIRQNVYNSGQSILIKFRHGNSEANCLLDDYENYSVPFESLGFVQIRIERIP